MKTIRTMIAFFTLLVCGNMMAQNGAIKGTVIDEKKQPMLFTPVALMIDTLIVQTTQTDQNGEFTLKDVTPGKYNMKAIATGYNITVKKGVTVESNVTRYIDIAMTVAAIGLPAVEVAEEWKASAFNPEFSTVQRINVEQIENSASGKQDIIGLITMVNSDILTTPDGKGIYMRGSRTGSTAYYVDGQRTMNIPDIPGIGIGGMEVLTGGVPAMYGDCTGGIVVIETQDFKAEMLRKENAIAEAREKAQTEKRRKETALEEQE